MERKKTKRGGYTGTPRKRGSAIPIGGTPKERENWRNRVEARLTSLGWSRADWSRESGVRKSTISNLLNGKANECADLDKLHRSIGWETLPAVLPSLEEEVLAVFRALSDIDKGRLLEMGKQLGARKP